MTYLSPDVEIYFMWCTSLQIDYKCIRSNVVNGIQDTLDSVQRVLQHQQQKVQTISRHLSISKINISSMIPVSSLVVVKQHLIAFHVLLQLQYDVHIFQACQSQSITENYSLTEIKYELSSLKGLLLNRYDSLLILTIFCMFYQRMDRCIIVWVYGLMDGGVYGRGVWVGVWSGGCVYGLVSGCMDQCMVRLGWTMLHGCNSLVGGYGSGFVLVGGHMVRCMIYSMGVWLGECFVTWWIYRLRMGAGLTSINGVFRNCRVMKCMFGMGNACQDGWS